MTIQPYQAIPAAYQQQQPNGQQAALIRPMVQGLCFMIHGFQKAGKSSWADTGPWPRLTLDVEGSAVWTPSRKVEWYPTRQTPPQPDGSWDTCVVHVNDYATLATTHEVLNRGQHPFNSVSVDSVHTVSQRVMMSMAGLNKMSQDQWGRLLRHVLGLTMSYKDLLTHPTRKVWAVTFVCGTHFDQRRGKYRPILSGQAADLVPYVPDVEGWLYADDWGVRHLWTGPSNDYETGERLWRRLPQDMVLGYPGMVEGWTVESAVAHVIATQ